MTDIDGYIVQAFISLPNSIPCSSTTITPRLLNAKAVVDANSTSATISWPYIYKYTIDNCQYFEINGNEYQNVELEPNYECSEKVITSSFTWNNHEINFEVIQKANVIKEPINEYAVKEIDGKSVINDEVNLDTTLSCGEGYEKNVIVNYSVSSYTNNCDETPIEENKELTTSIILDCTDIESIEDETAITVNGHLNILGKDIVYKYNCEKCLRHTCEPTSTVSNIVVTQTYINDLPVDLIPYGGESNISCDVSYTLTTTDEECNKKATVMSQKIEGLTVTGEQCENNVCCKKHKVSADTLVSIGDKETALWFEMEGTTTGICADVCEPEEIVTIKDWILIYKESAFTDDARGETFNIADLPIIPNENTIFDINYNLFVSGINESCEEYNFVVGNSYSYEIESGNCMFDIYSINPRNLSENGCIIQNPIFNVSKKPYTKLENVSAEIEIQIYNKDGEIHEIEGNYPKISFEYTHEICSTSPPNNT